MTNEQLIRQYYDGDDAALEKLYHKNIGLIRGIAKEAAAEFNCLIMEQHHPNQLSAYTKTILDDLCGEGALELLTRIQSREYDESRAVLTTYLYPHLKGCMTRWLEQNIGCMALSKDEMGAVRQAQRLEIQSRLQRIGPLFHRLALGVAWVRQMAVVIPEHHPHLVPLRLNEGDGGVVAMRRLAQLGQGISLKRRQQDSDGAAMGKDRHGLSVIFRRNLPHGGKIGRAHV